MTTITNPADPQVQLVFLRAHLRLMSKGLRHSKLSRGDVLNKVTAITGRTYRARGGVDEALEDINLLLK